MRKVGLIGCGVMKLDHPAPAGEMYTGPLFKAARAYVQATCDEWGILSAKPGHWALRPEEVIEPYDLSLHSLPADELRSWALVTRTTICNKWLDPALIGEPAWSHKLAQQTQFVVVAGARYRTPFQWGDLKWWSPWVDDHMRVGKGLGIGEQLAWLKAHTPKGEQDMPGEGAIPFAVEQSVMALKYLSDWMDGKDVRPRQDSLGEQTAHEFIARKIVAGEWE